MANISQTTIRTGTRLWPMVKKVFSMNFFSILLALILIYAIILSVQQSSLEPLVTGIGGRAFTALNSLNEDALTVLDESYLDLSFWEKFKIIASIGGILFLIIVWINLLSVFVSKSIFSGDTSRWLANWSLAVLIFVFLQVIFSLVAGHYGALGEDYSPVYALSLPWEAVKNTFNAMPSIIGPIIDSLGFIDKSPDTVYNLTNITSNS